MGNPKSPQKSRNIVIAILSLWSLISLITIVVWATSPDLKSASQCRAAMEDLREKSEVAKEVHVKNQAALEELVEDGRANQTLQLREIKRLTERLAQTNLSLDDCRQENVILGRNITALEKEIDMNKAIEANLTSEITLLQEQSEFLQENLTQASLKWESCVALLSAAESKQIAADSQTKACESARTHSQKQLQRCKKDGRVDPEQPGNGVATPQKSIPALGMVLGICLHLIL
ncbi:hypothetical protein DPEC_G00271040 [Dallia pectoralis]|uniref:Uncharacterized protein n=1 Tax=Dallia pectoralis TaxID=75939 RepID=A0ACC2FPG9_DALPE|nr:hypothetical protein DPEC_G00271040 [Dallia pectoralis]